MTGALLGFAAAALSILPPGMEDTKSHPPVHADHPDFGTTVQVRFLGGAGFLIRRGRTVVLTAPLYSNPGLGKVLLEKKRHILPRPDLIARFHPDVEDVEAILVGHAHYDHLMDVPYVWERSPEATIVGSLSTRNILRGYAGKAPAGVEKFPEPVPVIPADKVVALDTPEDSKVDARSCNGWSPDCDAQHSCPPLAAAQAGDYVKVGDGIRIRALCARHPCQAFGYHQGPCCISAARTEPPTAIDHFREGNVFVYLIDFMEKGRPVYRVYYQDVPADGTVGHVPGPVLEDHPVDLALLCAGNTGEVDHAEKIVANLKPAAVMIGHWEDFFRPQDQWILPAPLQDVERFYNAVRRELNELGGQRRLHLPRPGVLITFPPPPPANK